MKHGVVLFLTVIAIFSIFYFRQNPEKFENIKESVTKPVPNPTSIDISKDLFLPDIKVIPPSQLYISKSGSKKMIRFNTEFANIGRGPLELIGHHDPKQNKTFATQYIKKTDGSGYYREIGVFVFHPAHNHWHVDNYVEYQLLTIKNGNEKDQLLASTGKQSFCIWDALSYDKSLPEAAASRFYTSSCGRNHQGISVGWADIYKASVEGQYIDISSIPDGDYILWFEVNPTHNILESDYQNNADWLKIKIEGSKLTVLAK